ncbi:matrix metalloproteinase-16-like protein, partial [Euroglyphus maynei]
FQVKKEGRVHIDIRFVSGEHGDGDPFDGPGNTLAHAYFPQYGGDAHFDNEEHWTVSSYSGTNIFQVAAHELGHSLGLGHSSARDSLMAPFYQKYKPKFKLHQDDVLAIQALYGYKDDNDDGNNDSSTETSSTSSDRPIEPDPSGDGPDLCQDNSIDAVTRIADGSTYVFKGQYYWRIETTGIADGFPRRISTDWDGLAGNLNAALTWADGKTFFFKGNKYWRFKNMRMDKGYPKLISTGFAGIPDNVDAAFIDTRAKPPFPRQTSQWWFDCQSLSRKLKRRPTKKRSFTDNIRSFFGISNTRPIASALIDSTLTTNQSEWRMHGVKDEFDEDFLIKSESPSNSAMINETIQDCKLFTITIMIIMFSTWLLR